MNTTINEHTYTRIITALGNCERMDIGHTVTGTLEDWQFSGKIICMQFTATVIQDIAGRKWNIDAFTIKA